jgi:hypothetical protein
MAFRGNLRLVGAALLAGLIVTLSACTGAPAPAEPAVNPTIVIVQYVTQVVATVTPAPPVTAVPPTAKAPAVTGYDPFAVQPYYPLSGCQMASRLHVGDIAFVAAGGEQLGIHFSKDVGFAPIARKLISGELLYILDGPTCNRNGLVWEVLADADDTRGYAIEGNGETYWLLPFGETYDAKVIRDRLKKQQNP